MNKFYCRECGTTEVFPEGDICKGCALVSIRSRVSALTAQCAAGDAVEAAASAMADAVEENVGETCGQEDCRVCGAKMNLRSALTAYAAAKGGA